MALNVISNYAANVAHRNLMATDAETTSSLAKLSSGTRVVSAKDDAASLAIGSRLNAEVESLRQATVNAGQAVSMLQIADGAMSQANDILIRMKTLAVQSSSGQLSNTERSMLNTEYQQLLSEIDRIAQDTEFNGNQLVAGASSTSTALPSISTAANNYLQAADGFAEIVFGPSVGDNAFKTSYDSTNGVLTVTNLVNNTSQGININSASAIPVNQTQEIVFDNLGVTIKLNSAFDKTTDIDPGGAFSVTAGETGAIATTGLRITSATASGAQGETATTVTISGASADNATLVFTAAGTNYSETGVDLSTTGVKTATLTDGTNTFSVEFNVTTGLSDSASNAGTSTMDFNGIGALVYGDAATTTTTSFTFKVGTGTSSQDSLTFAIDSANTTALGINASTIDGADATNANTALTALNTAIDNLNGYRATVGSSQNRLEFASANLASTIENQEAARSQLLDLDVASEMTMFTSKQVLMQAGVSMLAQANQMPQQLMRLFG